MKIYIKPDYQPQQVLSLEEVNLKLSRGEFDGYEAAWTPGLPEWVRLESINGIVLPMPPSVIEDSESPPPFRLPLKRSALPPFKTSRSPSLLDPRG